jgi:predicted RNase H-like HicB family nuclease
MPLRTRSYVTSQELGNMRYVAIIEKGPKSFGAYVPDLPGCVAATETEDDVRKLIQEAIEFHIEGLRQDGRPIPPPSSQVVYVEP